jgi:hypothetical protein
MDIFKKKFEQVEGFFFIFNSVTFFNFVTNFVQIMVVLNQ